MLNDRAKLNRYRDLLVVWDHFHRAFGPNMPLTRCQTGYKQWDINYEGVAHYGMIPDFLQDLHNVGMQPQDLSVLFRSANAFADMWTRCLESSYWFTPRFFGPIQSLAGNELTLSFTRGNVQVEVEETSDAASSVWSPADVTEYTTNGIVITMRIPAAERARFYRLKIRP